MYGIRYITTTYFLKQIKTFNNKVKPFLNYHSILQLNTSRDESSHYWKRGKHCAPTPSFSSCLDLAWHNIFFKHFAKKKEEIRWSEENFHPCTSHLTNHWWRNKTNEHKFVYLAIPRSTEMFSACLLLFLYNNPEQANF